VKSPEQAYLGVTLGPDQIANLTTYGAFKESSSSPSFTKGRGSNVSGPVAMRPRAAGSLTQLDFSNPESQNTQSVNTTADDIANADRTTYNASETDEGMHPIDGVPVKVIDKINRGTLAHQTNTFPNMAARQSIRDWNNQTFDDRWILEPGEIWTIEEEKREQAEVTTTLDHQSSQRRQQVELQRKASEQAFEARRALFNSDNSQLRETEVSLKGPDPRRQYRQQRKAKGKGLLDRMYDEMANGTIADQKSFVRADGVRIMKGLTSSNQSGQGGVSSSAGSIETLGSKDR